MLGFINSTVHAFMYTYYLISIVRPQWVQQWWKKYITQLQIVRTTSHLLFVVIAIIDVITNDNEPDKFGSLEFNSKDIFQFRGAKLKLRIRNNE